MKGLIINHDTKYIGKLIHMFKGCDVMHHGNFDKEKVETYDYIVLSGGPIEIDGDNIKDEKEWLKITNKPILGICLGIQILCLVYGEKMRKFDRNKKINENLRFIDKDYNMFYNHSYYFEKIPEGFFGEVKNGVVVYIKHKTKPILAFQGHPEMTDSGEFIRDFFLNKIVK
jgi:GMP synthase (glutamine-hydrolysing)